jgi:hypothetical protein
MCAARCRAALQTRITLQGNIELDVSAHREVSSVVMEHLIQTQVPVVMHESFKKELTSIKSSVKTQAATVENFESKSGMETTHCTACTTYAQTSAVSFLRFSSICTVKSDHSAARNIPPTTSLCRATREKNHPPWHSFAFDENFKGHMDWDLRDIFDKDIKLVK